MKKNVLITGAGGGIGYELSKKFISSGRYNVFITDCSNELCNTFNKLKDDLKNYDFLTDSFGNLKSELNVYPIEANLRNNIDIKHLVNRFDELDVLINNAGVGLNNELIETNIDEWKNLIDVNFLAPIKLTKQLFPLLKKTNGHIVNVSSGQVFFRLPSWGAYTATKSALSVFSELLSFELSKHNVRVSTIYPFMVNTPFYKDITGDTPLSKLAMNLIPLYSDTPEKVADKIFKAVENNKRIEYVNPINYLGILIRAFPPIANLFTYITTKFLIRGEDE